MGFWPALFFVCGVSLAHAQSFKVPELRAPVNDDAQILSGSLQRNLSATLDQVYKSGGPQIAVLVVQSLDGETVESASIKVVDTWKLGKAEKDNGALILVALKDRKVRIEVGQGLEGDLTDLYSKRIIDQILVPYFKKGRFDEGIWFSAREIVELTSPQHLSLFDKSESGYSSAGGQPRPSIPLWVIILVIIIIFFNAVFGRRRSGFGWNQGSSWGRRGGFGGGGFGGGFGGFGGGGGGFSGGGASGSW